MRKTKDHTDTVYSAKSSVLECITHITRYKTDIKDEKAVPDYLEYYFKFLLDNLAEYEKQETKDFRIKDALLLSIGQIGVTLMKYPQFVESIETVLKECVFPDFTSENE